MYLIGELVLFLFRIEVDATFRLNKYLRFNSNIFIVITLSTKAIIINRTLRYLTKPLFSLREVRQLLSCQPRTLRHTPHRVLQPHVH